MVLVCLPTANHYDSSISKHDYTTPHNFCQQPNKNTLEYNYIKSKELIETQNQKYQDIIKWWRDGRAV